MKRGQYRRTNLDNKPADDCVRDRHLVDVAPLQLGEEFTQIHFNLFVRSDLLRAGEKLLKIRMVADRIPDGINL
jgi:hypothetical protein